MNTPHGPESHTGDLDPLIEPGRWEALVADIGERAEPHLARRRTPPGVLEIVAHWARPTLAAAASLVVLAGIGTLTLEAPPRAAAADDVALAPALLPQEFADWLTGSGQPSVAELTRAVDAMDAGDPPSGGGEGGSR